MLILPSKLIRTNFRNLLLPQIKDSQEVKKEKYNIAKEYNRIIQDHIDCPKIIKSILVDTYNIPTDLVKVLLGFLQPLDENLIKTDNDFKIDMEAYKKPNKFDKLKKKIKFSKSKKHKSPK